MVTPELVSACLGYFFMLDDRREIVQMFEALTGIVGMCGEG